MSLLDAKPTEPTFVAKIKRSKLMAKVSRSKLMVAFATGTVGSFLLLILWMFLGMAFFTAKESDVPWYWPGMTLISGVFVLSSGGLLVTAAAAFVARRQGD